MAKSLWQQLLQNNKINIKQGLITVDELAEYYAMAKEVNKRANKTYAKYHMYKPHYSTAKEFIDRAQFERAFNSVSEYYYDFQGKTERTDRQQRSQLKDALRESFSDDRGALEELLKTLDELPTYNIVRFLDSNPDLAKTIHYAQYGHFSSKEERLKAFRNLQEITDVSAEIILHRLKEYK